MQKGVSDLLDQLLQKELSQDYDSSNTTAFLSFAGLSYLLLKYIVTVHSHASKEVKVLIYGPVFAITPLMLVGVLVNRRSGSSLIQFNEEFCLNKKYII